jgi:methionine synthase II (cobalamin-independent)
VNAPRIKTTVVGSYPAPDWLARAPSEQALADALAAVLAEQVQRLDADVVQLDEANLPGHPGEWRWAAAAINQVLRAVPKSAKPAVHLCSKHLLTPTPFRKPREDSLNPAVPHCVVQNAPSRTS